MRPLYIGEQGSEVKDKIQIKYTKKNPEKKKKKKVNANSRPQRQQQNIWKTETQTSKAMTGEEKLSLTKFRLSQQHSN